MSHNAAHDGRFVARQPSPRRAEQRRIEAGRFTKHEAGRLTQHVASAPTLRLVSAAGDRAALRPREPAALAKGPGRSRGGLGLDAPHRAAGVPGPWESVPRGFRASTSTDVAVRHALADAPAERGARLSGGADIR